MAKSFRQRLQIQVDPTYVTVDGEELMENIDKKFYTKTGLLVATAYNRVVRGYISLFDLYLSDKRPVIV